MTTTRTTRPVGALVGLLAAGLLVSGCGGSGERVSSDRAGSGAPAPAAGGAKASGDAGTAYSGGTREGATKGSDVTSAKVLPAERDIVYRATISVRVKDVSAAADRAEALARAAQGVVFAEETSSDPARPSASTAHLTLRVPPSEFRPVLRSIAGLGDRLAQSQTAEDVTTQVVDTESRVASQKRSVARVRALLAQANTIGEVVQVESELARREADLESLEAQLAKLKDVTALATIEADLVGPATPTDEQDLGFLAGLRGGWDAFAQVVLVSLTVLGALLPFLLLLAVLGVPAWVVARRVTGSRRRSPAPAE